MTYNGKGEIFGGNLWIHRVQKRIGGLASHPNFASPPTCRSQERKTIN